MNQAEMEKKRKRIDELMNCAVRLGLNASMYYLIPFERRERVLQADIDHAKKGVNIENEPDKENGGDQQEIG